MDAARRPAWGRTLKGLLALFVVGMLIARARGLAIAGPLWVLAVGAELGVLVAILWALVRGVRSARQGHLFDHVRASLARVLPARAAELAIGELELAAAAFRLLLRRPLPPGAPGAFTTMRTSQSGFIVPAAIVLTLAEMPALHFLLAARDLGPGAHLLLVFLNVYGITWLLGDRRLMQERSHVLDAEGLVLGLGVRIRGRIAYAQMRQVIRLEPGRTPTAEKHTRRVTPYDSPNVHLCLKEPVVLSTYFGFPLRAQHLDLFVDEPDRFVADLLAAARAGQSPPISQSTALAPTSSGPG